MYNFFKRIFDIFGSLIILLLSMPVLFLTAISIRIFNGKPILFKQERVGKNGVKFILLKFRSMKNSKNHQNIGNIDKFESFEDARKRFKVTTINDKRITKLGKFIRASHIDELPQLFNVIKGDMSLVGPRPDVKAQIADYECKEWDERISVFPGLTGWSQVKRTKTAEERTKLDLLYIRNRSFQYDLKILIMTIIKIFKMNSF